MYKKIFVPLMLINNNVYTFLSGIFVSLSINIFTSLCFEKSSVYDGWFMYLSSLMLLLASTLCMYLAVKLSKFQNYIIEKRIIDYENKKSIVLDATNKMHSKYVITYICTIVTVICGTSLLVFNFVLGN
mgnify:CR=1 FL=1|jgi:hypothetical protein